MKDRYKLNLFYSGKENAIDYLDVQEINENVFSATELRIVTLPMDFPLETGVKYKKELENKWIDLLPRLDLVETLSIRHKVNQEFFEAVCKMKNIKHLHIWTSSVDNFSSISKLAKLQRLELQNFSRLTDISPILTLKNLELLSIENSFKIDNYNIIGQMIKLKGLKLGGDAFAPKNLKLQSLQPFRRLRQLKHLDISSAIIIDHSYETILELENLERFDITIIIPKAKREVIKNNHKKLTAGFFMDWDYDKKTMYDGKDW